MIDHRDFKIENGVLTGYLGAEPFVEIPSCVRSIGEYAFWENEDLVEVVIPETVQTIEGFAFRGCRALRRLVIPTSVGFIGHYVIGGCNELCELVVEVGNKRYVSRDNCVIDKYENTLVLGCQSSVIPKDGTVTAIGDFAFASCEALGSVVIPRAVKQIRDYAFDGCYNLDSVIFSDEVNPNTPWLGPTNYIGCHAFASCEALSGIVIPEAVSCIGAHAFSGCERLASVTVGDTLDCIGEDAFCGCASELVLIAPEDSFAAEYAKEHGIGVRLI